MNWRRGLLRLWVAMSVGWFILVAVFGYMAWPWPEPTWIPPATDFSAPASQTACAEERTKNPALGNPYACFDGDITNSTFQYRAEAIREDVEIFAAIGLLPPLVFQLFLFTVCWVVSGFKRRDG
jgi:hypothetical protein